MDLFRSSPATLKAKIADWNRSDFRSSGRSVPRRWRSVAHPDVGVREKGVLGDRVDESSTPPAPNRAIVPVKIGSDTELTPLPFDPNGFRRQKLDCLLETEVASMMGVAVK